MKEIIKLLEEQCLVVSEGIQYHEKQSTIKRKKLQSYKDMIVILKEQL